MSDKAPSRWLQSFARAERAENNLALLRFMAAGAVLFAHCWPIALGGEALDPVTLQMREWFGPEAALSSASVHAFFVISGYLVAKSALTRGIGDYAKARALRIYPALIVNVLLSALLVGLFATSVPFGAFIAAEGTWKYIGNNLPMWNAMYALPGAFENNPLQAINGSLWTLPLEIRCYIAIGLFLVTGVLKRTWLFAALAAGLIVVDALVRDLHLLGSVEAAACIGFFLLGAIFHALRNVSPASIVLAAALLGAGYFMPDGAAAHLVGMLGFTWLVLCLGIAAPRAPWPEKLIGDPSYGIYIYAFPVTQFAVLWLGAGDPLRVFAAAAPVTLIIALASWRFIEQPALRLKRGRVTSSNIEVQPIAAPATGT